MTVTLTPSEQALELDALTLSRRLAAKDLTAVDLMKATLSRIKSDNQQRHTSAIVLLREEQELLREALKVDASSSSSSTRRGWLSGIPLAVKDLSNVAGIPTTKGGSPLYANFVPTRSDPFVQRLLDAGAIIIGKTNTPESGLGCHTFNARFGRTCNPYDATKSAGGSSGGAAVAVATRQVAVADGTDMMGSLRNPAGWNNLYSIRPTAGLLEFDDDTINPLSYPISTAGALARTVEDLSRMLETMAPKFTMSNVDEFAPPDKCRIAWLGDWGGQLPMEKGILEFIESSALKVFEDLGITVDKVDGEIYSFERMWQSWTCIRSAVIAADHTRYFDIETIRTIGVREELLWEIERGLTISSTELDEAGQIASDFAQAVDKVFETYDTLALPSSQVWPFPVEIDWPKVIEGVEMDTYHSWMKVMVPGSLGGLPCLTIPAGFGGENGLSIGIQLLGRRYSDARLFQIAQKYHGATKWPQVRPPPASS